MQAESKLFRQSSENYLEKTANSEEFGDVYVYIRATSMKQAVNASEKCTVLH